MTGSNRKRAFGEAGCRRRTGPSGPEHLADLRVMLVVTWQEDGEWDLFKAIQRRVKRLGLVQPLRPGNRLPERLVRRTNRFAGLYLPLLTIMKRHRYHVVCTWSMRTGIVYGLLNRALFFLPKPRHLLRDFHINLVRTDFKYRIRLALLRLALPGIDFFLCTSTKEAAIYTDMFGIPRSRIRFYPDSPSRHLFDVAPHPVADHVFAYGNSDRDFDTLMAAAPMIPAPVVILSQTYRPERPLPANVTRIDHRIPEAELIRYIVRARVVVLPLCHHDIAAGQNTMIEVMALGRPLVVTSNLATAHYAVHGATALFTEAGRVGQLTACVQFLLENRRFAEQMGRRARSVSRTYPDEEQILFFRMLETLLGLESHDTQTRHRLRYFA